MKKYLILTLVLSMLLSACSEKEEASVSKPEKSTIATESVAESLAEESSVEENGNESSTESSVSSDEDLEISDDPFNEESNIDFAEGKRLWGAYLKAIEPLKDEIGSSKLLNYMEDPNIYSYELYKEHVSIGEDEFYALDSYEKFLLYSAYVKISWNSAKIKPKNEKQWNSSVVHMVYNMIDSCEGDEVSATYRKLMDWNYLYYRENGEVFNFIEEFGIV